MLGEVCALCSSLCNYPYPLVMSSVLGTDMLLSTLFSYAVILYSSPGDRERV